MSKPIIKYKNSYSEEIFLDWNNLTLKLLLKIANFSFGKNLFSEKSNEKLRRYFLQLNISSPVLDYYLTGSLFLALGFFALLFLFLVFIGIELIDSFWISVFFMLAIFLLLVILPKGLAYYKVKRCEEELAFILREIAVYLEIGMPFEKSIKTISKRRYILSEDFALIVQKIKSGSSVQNALAELSAKYDSILIKRVVFLLSSIYETGASADQLKRMAEDISSLQISNLKMQSGKIAILSVVFIAISAIIPAFFCIFLALGPFFEFSFSSWQIELFFLVVFPLLSAVSLILMIIEIPSFSTQVKSNLDSFLQKRFKLTKRQFVLLITFISLFFAFLFYIIGEVFLSIFSFLLGPIFYSLALYFSQEGIGTAEKNLPDALYSVASVHKVMPPEKVMLFLSKGEFGKLSEIFKTALNRQMAGESFQSSLKESLKDTSSYMLERAIELMIISYETGADMSKALREVASDIASFFVLLKERAAVLSIQYYTIIAASSFLVPFILGIAVSMVPSFSIYFTNTKLDLENLKFSVQAYLVICSLFSSFALAFSSQDIKKVLLYFSFIAPFSQLVFLSSMLGNIFKIA